MKHEYSRQMLLYCAIYCYLLLSIATTLVYARFLILTSVKAESDMGPPATSSEDK